MKYISLFSGIECASVAAKPLGWEPVCFSEIEPFPAAVLAHHDPEVPNLGDVTAVDWTAYRGAAGLVIGGSPCQAFSVAGRRESLSDSRGNLTLAFVEAVNAIDAEISPLLSWRRLMPSTQLSLFGKTCRESSLPGTTHSGTSLPHWRDMIAPSIRQTGAAGPVRVWLLDPADTWLGECLTLNISEFPNAAVESSLSDVLLPPGSIPQKYFLSAKACAGILRRAAKRGKTLPAHLKAALEAVAGRMT